MTKKILILVTIALFCSTFVYSQLTFNVSPGLNMNSASFGYKISDRFVPYIGFQYLKVSTEYDYSYHSTSANNVYFYEDEHNMKGSLLIPNIGLKTFIISKNDIKAYANIMFSKPIFNASIEIDGEVLDEAKEEVEAISMFGLNGGVGCEYFFSENFSLGGEFGIRYINVNYEKNESNTDFDQYQNLNINTKKEVDFNLNVSPTYSKISLNFYF